MKNNKFRFLFYFAVDNNNESMMRCACLCCAVKGNKITVGIYLFNKFVYVCGELR